MTEKPFVITPENAKTALDVIGTKVTVLASNENTQGQEITLQSGDEGMGPPPHSHPWDESFFVTKGSVNFTCDGKTQSCAAGTFVHVPAGTVHAFQYGPDGGEMLEITGTQGAAVKMFTELDSEMAKDAPDIPTAVKILERNGAKVHI